MKTRLYNILNTSAKAWWYHRRLRKQGLVEEARQRERESILEDVRVLRQALENGGFLTRGRGGWTLHYGKWSRLMCYCVGLDATIPQTCLLLGIPVLDTTTIPDDLLGEAFRIPIANTHPGPEPQGGYGSLDHAPFE